MWIIVIHKKCAHISTFELLRPRGRVDLCVLCVWVIRGYQPASRRQRGGKADRLGEIGKEHG